MQNILLGFDDMTIEGVNIKRKKIPLKKINQQTFWGDYGLSNEKKMLDTWLDMTNVVYAPFSNKEVIERQFDVMNG